MNHYESSARDTALRLVDRQFDTYLVDIGFMRLSPPAKIVNVAVNPSRLQVEFTVEFDDTAPDGEVTSPRAEIRVDFATRIQTMRDES